MRIHQIRFQNLNSLTGEWSIDLTDPAYLTDGIFAIIGPTGAGKTTILDAVCLALYGRTPRLERVNNSSNEIMSRHTGSCFAEVSFETREGVYRCHWSQQRAKKKPDGELQAAKHEISDVNTGKVIASKLRDVAAVVEQITGMNFTQFTRSIMLAQGGFAAFLQAPADERAPILEQITGTEIYSEISMKVHQRRGEEKNRLEVMQAEIAAIKIMSEEEAKSLQQDLQKKIEQETEQENQLKSLTEALTWLQTLNNLEKEIENLQEEWQNYEERLKNFENDRLRLVRSRQAMILDGSYFRLSNLRNLQAHDLSEIERIRAELPLQREILERANQTWQDALRSFNALKKLRKTEGEKATKVRALDLLIKQQNQQTAEIESTIAAGQMEYEDLQKKLYAGKQHLQTIEQALIKVQQYLRENCQDEGLVVNLTGIAATFKLLSETDDARQNKEREWQQAGEAWKTLIKAREEIAAAHERNEQLLQNQQEKLRDLREKLQTLSQGHEIAWWRDKLDEIKEEQQNLQELEQSLREIAGMEDALRMGRESIQSLEEKQQLLTLEIEQWVEKAAACEREVSHMETEVALLSRIRDLEEERARLQDGSPCPLCGATQHPYARGNEPRMGEAELKLDKARKACKNADQQLQKRKLEKVTLDKELEHNINNLRETELRLLKETEHSNGLIALLGLQLPAHKPADAVRMIMKQGAAKLAEHIKQIKQIEALQKSEKELAAQYEECCLAFNDSATGLQQAVWKQEQAKKETERLRNEYLALETEGDNLRQAALREVRAYGIADLPREGLTTVLKALNKRKNAWESKQDEKIRLEKETGIAHNDMTNLATRLKNQQDIVRHEQTRLQQSQKRQQLLQKERFDLYGNRNPDEEESRLEADILHSEEALDQARQEAEMAGRNVESMEKDEKILNDAVQKRAPELQLAEQEFAHQLQEVGFAGEGDYIQAKLPADEQQALAEQEEGLKQQKTELQTRLRDKQEAWRQEKDKKVTGESCQTLQENQLVCERELKDLRDKIAIYRQTLKNHQENRRQMQEQLLLVEKQKIVLQRWQMLHDLIGSADGKKFRNFAQGLTFDIMIGHANRQLQKMTDRYLLRRNQQQALELNIIDHYQGGVIRSTANLSGGESFLVSLALALGLSGMASHKVSVDSLFLDEGFGLLDEETLDTALNTLAGLHQDGKLIGVISHVPALKERIGAQIQVIPLSGGRSALQGPGCAHC